MGEPLELSSVKKSSAETERNGPEARKISHTNWKIDFLKKLDCWVVPLQTGTRCDRERAFNQVGSILPGNRTTSQF